MDQAANPSRRRLLALAAHGAQAVPVRVLAGSPFLLLARQAFAQRNPFTLGVASGCPTSDGVVLWTRLAPDPLADGGGMDERQVQVGWELAADEAFQRILRRGSEIATREDAHSVHLELDGLAPARDYWYRFSADGARSEVGRARTAPAQDDPQPVRFAFCSCQQYEQGYYGAYRDMAAQRPDLVVHLGDYIYEGSWGHEHVRHHNGGIPMELDEFRARYALYKSDPDLQAAHAASPWLVGWDDHEVANDYTNDISPLLTDPNQFLALRAAAYRAWWEHMPVPRRMRPVGPEARIHGRWRFGQAMDIFMLDARQHRDRHACVFGRRTSMLADCPDRFDAARSMLGHAQEAWLERELAMPPARWTVLAQPTVMASVDRGDAAEAAYWMDGWDGYASSRQRLLDAIATHRPRNALVISGDVHSFWAAGLQRTPDDATPLATEFVGGAISSQGPSAAAVSRLLARNPHLRYGQGGRRGYAIATLGPSEAEVEFRAVADEKDPDAATHTLARFVVESGRAGVLAA